MPVMLGWFMARSGILHDKAVVPFQLIELARDLKEHHGSSRSAILNLLRLELGFDLSMNTLDDWLYYRTRVNS